MNRIGSLRGSALVSVIGAIIVQAACADQGPKAGPPSTIAKTADDQSAVVGTTVTSPLSVLIRDVDGKPVPNVTVTFVVTSGGGSLTGGATTTNRDGIATLKSWMLGKTAGTNTVAATVTGLPTAVFSATGVPGIAAIIEKLSIDPVCAPASGSVDSIAVQVTDRYGNVLAGEAVRFAVTSGGGTVSPETQVTGADGRAAARWVLGATVGGSNTATATRAGLTTPSVSFSTSIVEPAESITFASTVVVVDSLATFTPTVLAKDRFGNALACAPVALSVRQPTIASIGGGSITALRTGQTFLVATSIENQNARDSILVVVANIASPVVTASVPRFDLKVDTTFTVPVTVDMRASPERLGAATLQVSWDPEVLTYIGDTEGAAGPGVEVNASRAASGLVTLAVASASGLSGAVELRKLSFKASSTAARIGALTVAAIDLSGASTFASLVPKTVSVSYPLKTR